MELRSLHVLAEVVRCGSFTGAGEQLRLTQPSVSRAIRQIEDEIGHPVLVRDYRKVTLTDAGRIVHARALRVIREVASLDAELADLVELKRGVVTLGIPPLGGTLFVPLIKRFKDTYPAVELQLVEKGSKATERALLDGEIELGTLILPLDKTEYEHAPLSKARLVLVAPMEPKWARRKKVDLASLKNEPFILFPHEFGLNDTILQACRAAGFEPHVVSRSSHSQLILGLVESGVGLALLPETVVRGATGVALIPLSDPVIDWNIALAWPRRAYLSIAARAMVELARNYGIHP